MIATTNQSAVFSLDCSSGRTAKSSLPIGALRELCNAVHDAHHLRGAARQIGDKWVVGIKCPSKQIASKLSRFMCFRWDGNFGSAITITIGAKPIGWVGRAWIWSRHPAVAALRDSQTLTLVLVHNREPIAVIKAKVSNKDQDGFLIATNITTEDARRPKEFLIELDEELAYWETFALSSAWDTLLRVSDHVQVGWFKEFRIGLYRCARLIRENLLDVPTLNESHRQHWDEKGKSCPQEFWDEAILPLARVLRGEIPLLQFIRSTPIKHLTLVMADGSEERLRANPFDEVRSEVGFLMECILLSDTRTDFGRKVVFSAVNDRHVEPVEIPTGEFEIADAQKYWENLPSAGAIDVGDLVSASMQPADLQSIIDQIKAIRLGCNRAEAEAAIATMTEEANILNRWTIPWGARVQTSIGPFVEIDFYPYGDEISILLKTHSGQYRWAAFNLRKNAWNLSYVFQNRFEHFFTEEESELTEEVTVAFQLIITSIVRDFVVLEERESAFAIRRDGGRQGRGLDADAPRIVYIPRIRYVQAPDTKGLEKGLEYEARRPHHVRAHKRRAESASPYQRILAERYGFRIEPGFTFVRPHQRGGIAPDREVIYRSRSAMQSLFGQEASIESDRSSNWFQFERDVHDAMKQMGYKVDHVASAKNGDAGVDVFAESASGSEFWAIQCKCYGPKHTIGPAIIREMIGALAGYPSGTRGMIVTTSGYSSGATELAKQSGIELRLLVPDAKRHGQRTLVAPLH